MKDDFGKIEITAGTRDRKQSTQLYAAPHPISGDDKRELRVVFSGPYDLDVSEGARVAIELMCPTEIDDPAYVIGAKSTYRYGKVELSVRFLTEIMIAALQDGRHQLSKDELGRLLAAMSVGVYQPNIRRYGE